MNDIQKAQRAAEGAVALLVATEYVQKPKELLAAARDALWEALCLLDGDPQLPDYQEF